MKRFFEKFKMIFAAVSFAEQGEWDDAVKIADGSLKLSATDGKHAQPALKRFKKQTVDRRPQLQL